MKIKRSSIVLALCLVLVLGACSSGNDRDDGGTTQEADVMEEKRVQEEDAEGTGKEEEKEYQAKLDAISPSAYREADGIVLDKGAYISVIGKADGRPFWNEVKKGAEQAAADVNEALGYEGGDKVKVTYNGPAEAESVDEQVNILDEELARYPVAVAIAIADAKACEVQFDLAAENSIPVVAFDSGSDYKNLMAMVSTDNAKAAKEAAQYLAEAIGEKGEVVVLAHDSKARTAAVREQEFTAAMKKEYPEIKVADVYYLDEMKKTISDEVNKGLYRFDEEEPAGTELPEEERIKEEDVTHENVIDYILKKHPDVKGCCATNGEAVVSVIEGLARFGKEDVAVAGYDADEEELKALKEGKAIGLMVQNPFGMGYASVIAASRSALGMANEAYIDTGYLWMTKENMESEEVQKMLY